MGVEFATGRLSREAVRRRAEQTTTEQLAALTNDPAFHEWQAKKARRENNARSATNLLVVAACVALAVTMALLKPAATAPAPFIPAAAPAAANPIDHMAADLTSEAATYAVAFGFYDAAVTPLDGAPTAVHGSPATAAAPGATPLSPEEVQLVLEMAQYRMHAAQAEAEAAEDAAADLTLRLTAAEEERELVAARLAQLEAASATKEADARFSEVAAAELLAHMTAQLEDMRQEVVAAEAAAAAAANLAEATAAAAAALLEAPPGEHLSVGNPVIAAAWPSEVVMAELEASQVLPQQHTIPFLAAGPSSLDSMFNASWAPPSSTVVAPPPVVTPMSLAICTAAAAFAATVLAAALLHLRSRRRLAAEAARASALSARLKEAAFAKDTAEQSLGLLERELQRRMKQLEDAQQAAADAASPKIGTTFAPPSLEGAMLHTPGRGELPPPPASLVEKFLRDHNFLAVQHEQMTEWLEMEQQYGEMQGALEELQGALAEKDAQIAAYEQDLSSVNEHTHVHKELRSCEDQLAQVRAWLDEAQEELLETQAALQEREAECRLVSSQLQAMQTVAVGAQESATSLEGRDGELQRQNLDLVAQLQSVTSAYEAMQTQLAAASASGEALALGAFGANAARPASANTVPGTPVDLSREVQSCLEMMRATRAQLADRLAHSQGVCESMIADCQVAQGGGLVGAFTAAADSSSDGEEQEEEEASPAASPGCEPAPFGSPAAVTPLPAGVETNPLFEAEGWEGEEELSSTSLDGAAPAEEQCSVLGSSRRFNTSLQTTPSPAASKSPAGSECTPGGASDGSMRSAWQSAHSRVAEARAMHSGWDLAGFVRSLGFQVEESGVEAASSAPMDRAAFEALRACAEEALAAAAAAAETSPERALAGQAMQVVRDWEFPVQRINTPPPSPFWRLLGLQS